MSDELQQRLQAAEARDRRSRQMLAKLQMLSKSQATILKAHFKKKTQHQGRILQGLIKALSQYDATSAESFQVEYSRLPTGVFEDNEKATLEERVQFLTHENEALKSSLEALQVVPPPQSADTAKQLMSMRKLLKEAQIHIQTLQQRPSVVSQPVSAPKATIDISITKKHLQHMKHQLDELRKEAQMPLQQLFPKFKQQLTDRLNVFVRNYQHETKERKRLFNTIQEMRGNIRVLCRVRPISTKEHEKGFKSACMISDTEKVSFSTDRGKAKTWCFDHVFPIQSTEDEVFAEIEPLITSALDGYNICIFAYGQTGAGKTHSMSSITTHALKQLLEKSAARQNETKDTTQFSMMEIYNEKIRDLLSEDVAQSHLSVRQGRDGKHYVEHLTTVPIEKFPDVEELVAIGEKNRATNTTEMNVHSSRSHLILSIEIFSRNQVSGIETRSKIYLIDLAGSERLSKTHATGLRLKEAQNINKSLSALGDVLSARVKKSAHVPYRNSQLTYLLSNALQGDSKTVMLACVSPVDFNAEESFCTLNFAARARLVQVGPVKRNIVV